jgi:hypothetical protein
MERQIDTETDKHRDEHTYSQMYILKNSSLVQRERDKKDTDTQTGNKERIVRMNLGTDK